ncbi:glucose-6-phosphate isomerase [Methylocella sp.]|uniref:glucose-6-phosphate isomerase n=1 Tax=Methylocella sp. TaxID=1978226 RepID=UPI003784ECFB
MHRSPIDRSRLEDALGALRAHAGRRDAPRVDALFRADPERFARFSVAFDDLLYDFSKQPVDGETLRLLVELARAAGLEAKREAFFAGEPINHTEGRAALHMALRDLSAAPAFAAGEAVEGVVATERARLLDFAEAVRAGAVRAANGARFTDVVNFGIGGSDLGPAMAARALSPYVDARLRLHFVANVDGADFADTMKGVALETTLFVVCSKTFTTLETMTNAASARARVAGALGEAAVADHFCAVSTRADRAEAFGLRPDRVFGFWDWVGGRYSIWSAIGLSLAIGIGRAHFEDFLRGGADVDAHFRSAPLERNIPALMGLIGVLNRNVHGRAAHAVIPYDQRLARFPAYLQQLEMESNGKSVDHEGRRAALDTCPVVWGEPGTNGQHAFFQLLHQGTEIVPVDFLVAARPTAADEKHHQLLFANCLAQAQALMQGRGRAEVERQLAASGLSPQQIAALAPHKVFDGDRPSSLLLYASLTPRTLGRLIALYEHKVFVQGVIWDVNSFDQWGVELGKELAVKLAPIVADPAAPLDGLDGSTAGLIAAARARRREA